MVEPSASPESCLSLSGSSRNPISTAMCFQFALAGEDRPSVYWGIEIAVAAVSVKVWEYRFDAEQGKLIKRDLAKVTKRRVEE